MSSLLLDKSSCLGNKRVFINHFEGRLRLGGGGEFSKTSAQVARGDNPDRDDGQEEAGHIGGASRNRREGEEKSLVDHRSARFA